MPRRTRPCTPKPNARRCAPRWSSSRRAIAKCCCCGIRDCRTTRSRRRADWHAAPSARRSPEPAAAWWTRSKRERRVNMSHVDEGTLHGYLDGELPAGEAHDLEAHVAQCRECRARLDEERALIARADELLGLAAPPDRAVPPFRPGDREPPVRLWWRVRLPLAWAATVVLALGTGLYLGSGVLPRQRAALQNSGDVATAKALTAPAATEPTPSPAAPRQMQRLRSAPAAPTTVAAERKSAVKDQPAEEVASERAAREVQPSTGPPATPAPTVTRIVGPYAVTGLPL